MRIASLALILLLSACQGDDAPATSDKVGSDASGLERAAIASGVIPDAERLSPVGFYQRRHETGRDALCLIPSGKGDYRFGAEVVFGEGERCRGHGIAHRAGDKLILSFAGSSQCIAVAQYDGDMVVLPGVLDVKCAHLCDDRGSLEGVSFPRLTGDAASALRAADSAGEPLCPAQ